MKKETIIRKNGGGCTVAIPIAIFRALGLSVGDSVLWDLEGTVVTLQFFKVVQKVFRVPVEAQEEAPVLAKTLVQEMEATVSAE